MKKSAFAIIALVTVLVSTLFASASASIVVNDPKIRVSSSASLNWSGYAIQTNLANPQTNAVSDVVGSWNVPTVKSGPKNTYSSFWVGIDGYSDGTVEQIGTDSDTNNKGQPVYYAWYEMYPAYPVNLFQINPGDSITAEVSFQSSAFTLTITDTSTGATYTTTQQSSSSIQRSSAEWIAEAPSSGGRVLPLANFGTVTFTSCSATINGKSGSISNKAWQNDAITMVARNGIIKAQPSTLDAKGRSFSVTWFHQ
jgi:hypothetical protein